MVRILIDVESSGEPFAVATVVEESILAAGLLDSPFAVIYLDGSQFVTPDRSDRLRSLGRKLPRSPVLLDWANLKRELDSQRKWVEECGGNLSGYIANYTRHGRTIDECRAIYDADAKVLRDLSRRVEELEARL